MTKFTMTAALAALIALLFLQANLGEVVAETSSENEEERRSVEANIGVVAADEERCSRIGVSILRQGGNAVDAAVGTALCQGVVQPTESGIGGGSFLVLRLANGTAVAYDFRETAPAATSEDLYLSNPALLQHGALSVGVPGELAGLYLVWQRYGKLPWRTLVTPAAKLALNGFVVARYLAAGLKSSETQILADPGLREVFAPRGKLLEEGEVCVREALGKTLTEVGKQGPGVFYNGYLGERFAADLKAAGGILEVSDLHNYKVRVREPVRVEAFGLTLLGMPPPSSGGACTALVLHILAGYKESNPVAGAVGLHRTVEAFKHCYAVRANLGDPDFSDISGPLADMLSSSFADQLRGTIDDKKTFDQGHYGGKYAVPEEHGTSHFSIVDGDRNAVAMTTTINEVFGARLASLSTGIIYNNELADFALPSNSSTQPAAPANRIGPNKRPLSSMSPTIILDKDGHLTGVVGGSGGIRIITTVLQVLLNHYVKGLSPSQAISRPRVHHQWVPNVLQYENQTVVSGQRFEVRKTLLDALRRRGHVLQNITSGAAVSQLVIVQDHAESTGVGTKRNSKLVGVSDPRKDGFPAGY